MRHSECLTSFCTVQLVLERGRNVIAVGAADAVSRGAGFATTQVLVDIIARSRPPQAFVTHISGVGVADLERGPPRKTRK